MNRNEYPMPEDTFKPELIQTAREVDLAKAELEKAKKNAHQADMAHAKARQVYLEEVRNVYCGKAAFVEGEVLRREGNVYRKTIVQNKLMFIGDRVVFPLYNPGVYRSQSYGNVSPEISAEDIDGQAYRMRLSEVAVTHLTEAEEKLIEKAILSVGNCIRVCMEPGRKLGLEVYHPTHNRWDKKQHFMENEVLIDSLKLEIEDTKVVIQGTLREGPELFEMNSPTTEARVDLTQEGLSFEVVDPENFGLPPEELMDMHVAQYLNSSGY